MRYCFPMSDSDPYAGDIFAGHSSRAKTTYPTVAFPLGEVVEDIASGWVGEIVEWVKTPDGIFARLEDRHAKTRLFPLVQGAFLYEGRRITLTQEIQKTSAISDITNSGSRRPVTQTAQVAKPSRIWVEGIHDAAIVQQVWGDDLAAEGIAVEYLEGLDNLEQKLAEFAPSSDRRVGVLADHLIQGTKEDHLTRDLGPYVMVTGHPYIDIWAAVKPSSVGIEKWPDIPRGQDWKTGVATQLGWGTPQDAWRKIIGSVSTFRDLDISLIGAVEQLIDFVSPPDNP